MLVEIRNVSQTHEANGTKMQVLDDINLSVGDYDFVCILGPSGCGKSTLLRIIMGLEKPASGEALFRGSPVHPGNPKVSLVFQNFALFPWLTVKENIGLVLEPTGLAGGEQDAAAMKYIKRVGLEGFENAYPRELSGGMKQRVGFARALAVDPVLMCMDEPFSALDSLTAQNLREELVMVWEDRQIPPDAVIMVTHSVEEAVYLATRIIVLSPLPGRVVADLNIGLKRPRSRKDPEFHRWVDKIYSLIV